MNTHAELLEWGSAELAGSSQTPRLDAEVLLCAVAACSKAKLLASLKEPVSAEYAASFKERIARRKSREPVAYITGVKEFWGLEFLVNPGVLVPRPETELLVEKALAAAGQRSGPISILDLGTGSGCLVVAIGSELKKSGRECKITAVDSSTAALEMARRNVEKHGLAERIELRKSNWFSALEGLSFDLIVSNPPYIAIGDSEISPELKYEPDFALFAGIDGTEVIRRLMREAPGFLGSGGRFLCEFGYGQRLRLEEIFEQLRDKGLWREGGIRFYSDLAGIDRVMELG